MKLRKPEIAVVIVASLVLISVITFGIISMPRQVKASEPIAPIATTPITDVSDEGISIYSPKIKISGIEPGGTADGMTLNIKNGTADNVTMFISVVIPERLTTDADTMLEYSPAPKNAQKWIVVSQTGDVEVPAQSVISIPVSLTIPKDIKGLPERWEFDIKVSEYGGFATTALIQRYLITMR